MSKNDLINSYNPTTLCDFCDGDLYKEILEGEDGDDIRSQKAFTLIMNTNGTSMGDGT